ncbi:MAG TPA: acetolactate synthase 2 catalytic subunit [Planctomycetota bacterium]|jgi:acetolactate synthase-1/2/3 large subunit|nr:acetolactate synthase 2 catalytic subunit [Planctomycetota bacterium]
MPTMRGAEFVCRALEAEGVDTIFGYPGGAIMPFYDAIVGAKFKHILVRHEQGAAFAANGYARASGRVGVCVATSGPGATNLVTGIADAFMDSVPMVALTGQVRTFLIGTDAFQETDIFGITLPIVKHSFLVRRAEDLPQVMRDAFRIARSGRPGPVLVDIPRDVQEAQADLKLLPPDPADGRPPAPSRESIEKAARLLRECRKPVIYAGGGVGMAGALEEFRGFVQATRIPVVHTLKGLGGVPWDEELFLGMLGMHGFKQSNIAVHHCDLLICIGARFDDRATGKLSEFASGAKVIHMDVDASEVGKLRRADAGIVGDIRVALRELSFPLPQIEEWRRECLRYKKEYAWNYNAPGDGVYMPAMLKELSERADDRTIVTCDVGQHQMWVAQHYGFRRPELHLTSGGTGAMGFGLPAAIGAQLARPDCRVICVTGDGSIMMNIQEMATIKRYNIPVKILLVDNQALGMVRQWQELFFARKYSEIDLSDNPDFVRLAEAFGIPAFFVRERKDVPRAIDRLLHERGPLLAHVWIEQAANVWPLVPPGKSNAEMLVEERR